jgi:hypothetical protein
VNDAHTVGEAIITCRKQVFNEDKPDMRFVRYYPTDLQLARASAFHDCDWESPDGNTFYASRGKSGKQVGSLTLIGSADEE